MSGGQVSAESRQLQNKAWGIFRRYPTYSNIVNFKQAKAKARYTQRQTKKTSWQD